MARFEKKSLMVGSILGYFGCALMFAGMLLAQLWPKKHAH